MSQECQSDAELSFADEDVIEAFVSRVLDPILHEQGEEEVVIQQLEAIAWLYNHHSRSTFPQLAYMGAHEICNTVRVLRPAAAKYLGSVAEKRISNACKASKPNSSSTKIERVAVLLLNSSKTKCLLLQSLITKSVWSFIEEDVPEGSRDVDDEILHVAAFAVKKWTDVTSLDVGNVTYETQCMSQAAANTRLYAFVCVGYSPCFKPANGLQHAEWISVDDVLNRTNGNLLEFVWGTRSGTSTDYFHIRPFTSHLYSWLSDTKIEYSRYIRLPHKKNSNDSGSNFPISPDKRDEQTLALAKRQRKASSETVNGRIYEPIEEQQANANNRDTGDDDVISNGKRRHPESLSGKKDDRSCNPVLKNIFSQNCISTSSLPNDKFGQRINVANKSRDSEAPVTAATAVAKNPIFSVLLRERDEILQKLIDLAAHYKLQTAILHQKLSMYEDQINSNLQDPFKKTSSQHLPDIFSALRDPIQDLNDFCCKNKWAAPVYSYHSVDDNCNVRVHTATVQISGKEFQHSERGAPSLDFDKAKQLAAAALLGRLHLASSRPSNSLLL